MIERGTYVVVTAYGGKQLERIVWEDVGNGVLLTTETEYKRAMEDGVEPICVGFPKDDIVDVLAKRI